MPCQLVQNPSSFCSATTVCLETALGLFLGLCWVVTAKIPLLEHIHPLFEFSNRIKKRLLKEK